MNKILCCVWCRKEFHSGINSSKHAAVCSMLRSADVQAEYDAGSTVQQVADRYGVTRKGLALLVTKRRNKSEAGSLAYRQNPAASPLRKWHKALSPGEKVFFEMAQSHGLERQHRIVREMPIWSYRLDFAFVDLKIDVEVDGRQHLDAPHRAHDEDRDRRLSEAGWSVYRIASSDFLRRPNVVFQQFLDFLSGFSGEVQRQLYPGQIIDGRLQFVKEREELILGSGIDFSKSGWTVVLGLLLNISSSSARRWVQTNMPDFYDTCRTPRRRNRPSKLPQSLTFTNHANIPALR